jgi:hypothetical protein
MIILRITYKLIFLVFIFGCDRPSIYTSNHKYVKSGKLYSLSNTNDTLKLGDTLGIHFNVPSKCTMDDGTSLNIKNEINTQVSFTIEHYTNATTRVLTPLILEQKSSATNVPGIFSFNGNQIPLFDALIHFFPPDTGLFVIQTSNVNYTTCLTNEFEDKVGIEFKLDFNVSDNNLYLLKNYPNGYLGFPEDDARNNRKFYAFYVSKK